MELHCLKEEMMQRHHYKQRPSSGKHRGYADVAGCKRKPLSTEFQWKHCSIGSRPELPDWGSEVLVAEWCWSQLLLQDQQGIEAGWWWWWWWWWWQRVVLSQVAVYSCVTVQLCRECFVWKVFKWQEELQYILMHLVRCQVTPLLALFIGHGRSDQCQGEKSTEVIQVLVEDHHANLSISAACQYHSIHLRLNKYSPLKRHGETCRLRDYSPFWMVSFQG